MEIIMINAKKKLYTGFDFGKHVMLTNTCFVPLHLHFPIPTYVSTFCYKTGFTEVTYNTEILKALRIEFQ